MFLGTLQLVYVYFLYFLSPAFMCAFLLYPWLLLPVMGEMFF